MSWILGGIYCGVLWLVFAKFKLLKLSLPVAIVAASVGPGLIVALLFCAQYFHPFTSNARVFQGTVPIVPQLRQAGRVLEVIATPNTPIKQGEILFTVDPVPYDNAVARLEASLKEAEQSQAVAEASIDLAKATLDRATANFKFATRDRDRLEKLFAAKSASQQDLDTSNNRYAEASATTAQADASLVQAELSVDLAKTRIAQTETQLADAKYDQQQTVVTAPGDGFVTNLQLQKA